MDDIRWPDDIPPPWARLFALGERCLAEVNIVARDHPATTRLEHELLDILRSQALAIETLSEELLRVRREALDDPFTAKRDALAWIDERHPRL